MSKTIAIANFKGGLGKTTSCVNIGAGLANAGKKVLLVDLDPQFNLTQSLGLVNPDRPIYGAFKGEYDLLPIEIYEGLEVVPSSLELIKGELELSSLFKREEILSKLLAPIKERYDYIILDCPPSLGVLTINAFVAADYIYVPIESEYLALRGFAVLTEAISTIGLSINKVFVTKYDSRIILNRHIADSIQSKLGDRAFKTIIRKNIALAEAPLKGLDIFRYQANSRGAEDYNSLVDEILLETK